MEELYKNDIIELTVENQGMDGEGVAHAGGKTVFIRGALSGERVRAKIIAVKPRFDIALLERVLIPSPHRITPACPVFGKCGGCDLQHMSYDYQLELKRRLVEQTFAKVGGLEVNAEKVVPSEKIYRCRNKISLPVRQYADGLKIGLFAKNSHRVVETEDCLLQYDWTRPLIAAFGNFTAKCGYRGYNEENGAGDIRHLVAREAGGRLYVTVVATGKIDCAPLTEAVKGIRPDCEIFLNVNRRRDNVILGEEWHKIYGDDSPVELDGLKTTLHPAGFYQVNDFIRDKLYDYVADMCEGGAAVEAYSGAGLLSARLAKKAAVVYGIEINGQAHEAAVTLKERNGIDNFFPVLGDVSEKLKDTLCECASKAGRRGNEKTFIVLDPPRSGVSGEVIDTLAASGAENIVYIGCNPSTLARDALLLVQKGYRIVSVKPFDMFPQTSNVETAVLLSRRGEKPNEETLVENNPE